MYAPADTPLPLIAPPSSGPAPPVPSTVHMVRTTEVESLQFHASWHTLYLPFAFTWLQFTTLLLLLLYEPAFKRSFTATFMAHYTHLLAAAQPFVANFFDRITVHLFNQPVRPPGPRP